MIDKEQIRQAAIKNFKEAYPGFEVPLFEVDDEGKVTFMANFRSTGPGYNFIIKPNES